MINIEYATTNEINISLKEVLRYLGYGNNTADEKIINSIKNCIAEIEPILSCKACYDKFPVLVNPDGSLNLDFTTSKSKNLSKNLRGCEEIILFAATIGINVDRIIQKASILSPFSAVIAQAVGTVAIEEWCDILCRRFEKQEMINNRFLRPRFSPGYGDFPLNEQNNIFRVLDCSRKIGVTLTDSLLMLPTKSVSAIIGISKNNLHCTPHGCEVCNNIDCDFRRS